MRVFPALYLGIDGGGSKTDLAVADAHGHLLARVRAGSTSLTRRPAAEVERELAAALEQAGRRLARSAGRARDLEPAAAWPAAVVACCGGFAGAGPPARRRRLAGILRRLLPRARVLVVPDFEIAYRGALGDSDGILLIAGTGSVAVACRKGRQLRAGGRRPTSGDPGSAEWIGRRAGAPFAVDGAGPPAARLPAVVAAARAGDARAARLLDRAADELAALVVQLARRLHWAAPTVVALGGVIRHAAPVRQRLRQSLARRLPQARLRFPAAKPVFGAVACALAALPPSAGSSADHARRPARKTPRLRARVPTPPAGARRRSPPSAGPPPPRLPR